MISVIVPNYNHAPYLRQRIESILNQTYQDFELILLDDCSSDNSRQILLEYHNHPKVSHCVFNEQNSGSTFRQWNKGVELAKGEYIWIAESDDWAVPEFLSTLCTLLDENSQVGLAYCNTAIYENDISIGDFAIGKKKKFGVDYWDNDYIIDGKKEIERVLIRDCTINNTSAVLFRRNYLLLYLPELLFFKYSGDWFCYLKIASISDISYSSKVMNNYRDHSANTSKKAGYNYLIELFHIYAWILKEDIIDKKVLLSSFHNYVSDVYSMGLEWRPIKDICFLYKTQKELYYRMTWKLFKRKIRRTIINFK